MLLRILGDTIDTDWTVIILVLVWIVVLGVQHARPQHEDVLGLGHAHQAWQEISLGF